MSLRPVQIKQLRNLLQIGSDEQIVHSLEKIHPADIALLFNDLNNVQIKRLVDCLHLLKKAGSTLKELPEFMLPDVLELIGDSSLIQIITKNSLDDTVFLLTKVPENRRRVLLLALDERLRFDLEKLLLYPKHSAGSVMNPVFFAVPAGFTVAQTIAHLQSFADREGIFYVYVLDDQRLVGVLSLKSLVIAKSDVVIKSLMKSPVYSVAATSDQEEVAQLVSKYNLLAVPVVNDRNELIGVISIDDAIDIYEEEAAADIYNMAGLSGEDRAFTPVWTKIKKRLPWILVNLTTAFVASMVVGFFEDTIKQMALLAAYMPIVAGLGGNGGTQSMVVITRSIALGEMDFSIAYKAILKEVANGTVLGIIAGACAGTFAYLVNFNPLLGFVLFLSMVTNMFLAGLMGSSVPLILKKLGLDPAVGSGIFVTATTDISGFFVFLGLAKLFLV